MNNDTEGFFVEINLRNKKKWLLSCSYNPKKALISNHLAELGKNNYLYLNKYDQLFSWAILMRELRIHQFRDFVLVLTL